MVIELRSGICTSRSCIKKQTKWVNKRAKHTELWFQANCFNKALLFCETWRWKEEKLKFSGKCLLHINREHIVGYIHLCSLRIFFYTNVQNNIINDIHKFKQKNEGKNLTMHIDTGIPISVWPSVKTDDVL